MEPTVILEIAVICPHIAGLHDDNYWRLRWVADGEEIDHVEQFECIHSIARVARSEMQAGETVAWRYYPTSVEAREFAPAPAPSREEYLA